MIDPMIDSLDVLNNAISDLTGISYSLCYQATIEGDNLSRMLSCVINETPKLDAVGLHLNGCTDMTDRDNECELGYKLCAYLRNLR